MKIRQLLVVSLSVLVVACGGSDGGFAGAVGGGGGGNNSSCNVNDQKAFVLEAMRDVYFWNDLLPNDVDLAAFATPEELLVSLTAVQPLDRFSFIGSAAADSARFELGEATAFGFRVSLVDEATNDVRILSVEANSPADRGGLQRGQQLLAVDGVDVATLLSGDGVSASFGPTEVGVTRTLTLRNLDDSEFDSTLVKEVITLNSVPQVRTYTIGGTTYGYIEFSTFVRPAEAELDAAFEQFNTAGITDVIIDVRYNGGGLVETAEYLGDLLGGFTSQGRIFSETLFNEENEINNRTELFELRGNSLNTSRLVFITTGGSASASEMVINSMEPEAQVDLVGSTTFGKPVGQVGLVFCDGTKILRPASFEIVNNLGEGRYFDGLPADCAADDDFTTEVGSMDDPSTAAALTLLSTGSCPVVSGSAKAQAAPRRFVPMSGDTASQEFAYIF